MAVQSNRNGHYRDKIQNSQKFKIEEMYPNRPHPVIPSASVWGAAGLALYKMLSGGV